MAQPLFRAYLAVSADGFIARSDGSVDWLHDYDPVEFGYNDFYAGLGHIVMGRSSYEQARAFGPDWHYAGKPCTVVTSQALADLPPGVRTHGSDFAALAHELRSGAQGDVWLFGGAQLWAGFLSANAVDRFELYVIPHMIGEGMPLFPPGRRDLRLELLDVATLSRGVIRQVYRPL
ncbi:MAG: dihydrofolate reductase [Alphaproteobacteria bacterium]|nr:dihydrofolate reductase [Alphaproteobacteria bacterium]